MSGYTVQYGHPDDPDLKTSPTHWHDFLRSLVWEDMKTFYKDRLEIIKSDLMVESDPKKIAKLQAEAQSCQMALELPEQMLEWSKDQEQKGGDGDGSAR